MQKKIYCVYSHNKLDFKKYVKSANYDDVISFHDIITKLVKNDVNSNKPSTFIINSYIKFAKCDDTNKVQLEFIDVSNFDEKLGQIEVFNIVWYFFNIFTSTYSCL